MRILFYNHTGLVSGAERSLLELVGGLKDRGEEVLVASPEGPLGRHIASLGLQHEQVPGTTASFKLSLPGYGRAGAELARAAIVLQWVATRFGADVVHANSIRGGLIAGLAGGRSGAPVVVHARDALQGGVVVGGIRLALGASADHVVAISQHVQRALGLRGDRVPVSVLHNPVDLKRFDPSTVDRAAMRTVLGAAGDEPLLGVIAQITPWKGQDDAIRMLAALKAHQPGARLLLVGEPKFVGRDVRFDNMTYNTELAELVNSLGLADSVDFLGEREDVPEVLSALDLLLVPSWQEPFGRTVIEGMAMGRAVMATSVGGPAEVLADGVDGRLLPPRSPEVWAAAAAELLGDRARLARMEEAARAAAQRFDRDAYVERIVAVYGGLLSGRTASDVGPAAPTAHGSSS
jgi:glycosyltransferase involved in cell wall biosynthesis